MGTLYYAVNHDKRQIYELGKSFWLDDDPESEKPYGAPYIPPRDLDDLTQRVRRSFGLEPGDALHKRAVDLIAGLWAMGVQDVLNDSAHEPYDSCGEYTLVGSIYNDAESLSTVGKPFKVRYE